MAAGGSGCQWKDGDYCLFKSPRDVLGRKISSEEIVKLQTRLHVISSSLHCQQEVKVVQGAVCIRVRYFELNPGKGTINTFNLGVFDVPIQMYTCVIDMKRPDDTTSDSPVYLLVCLSVHSEGLDLFNPELDTFVSDFKAKLHPLPEDEILLIQSFTSSPADELLVSWQNYVHYIANFVDTYKHQLPSLLYCLLNHTVKVCGENEELVKETELFCKACKLDTITEQQKPELKRALSGDGGLVTVTVGMVGTLRTLSLSSEESTDFANNWSKAMLSIAPSPSKPFALKKVIKSIKLKIIQDINSLKRLLKEAESSYYALYKCFTFLQESGNKDVLLRCSYMEARTQNETATLEIIATLKEFFRRQTGTNTSSIGTGTNTSSIGTGTNASSISTLETSLIQF